MADVNDPVISSILIGNNLLHLIDNFRTNRIDYDTFINLTDEEVKELAPSIGDRKKIKNLIEILKADVITEPYSSNGGNESSIEESGNKESSIEQNNGPAVEAENENQDDIVKLSRKLPAELKIHISESERHIENFDLKQVLQESLDGKLLLAAYFLKDGLEPTDINTLCHLVISSCILNGFPSKKHIFEKLKEKILELFPNIDPETLYVPALENKKKKRFDKDNGTEVNDNNIKKKNEKGNRQAKGKLFDKYRNLRTKIRDLQMLDDDDDEADIDESSSEPLNKRPRLETTNESILWLNDNHDKPVNEIESIWNETFPERKSDLFTFSEDFTSVDFLNKWNPLTGPYGHLLMKLDFQQLYPDKINCIERWSIIRNNYKIITEQVKDRSIKKQLKSLDINATADQIDALCLRSLAAIYVCKARFKHSNGTWRPSIVESADALVLHVTVAGDIKRRIEERKSKLLKFKVKLQPLIVVVGKDYSSINSVYVVLNEVSHRVDSVLEGINYCFMCFHTTQTGYPDEAVAPWQFLQEFIWNIKTSWDVRGFGFKTLMDRLNQLT